MKQVLVPLPSEMQLTGSDLLWGGAFVLGRPRLNSGTLSGPPPKMRHFVFHCLPVFTEQTYFLLSLCYRLSLWHLKILQYNLSIPVDIP